MTIEDRLVERLLGEFDATGTTRAEIEVSLEEWLEIRQGPPSPGLHTIQILGPCGPVTVKPKPHCPTCRCAKR